MQHSDTDWCLYYKFSGDLPIEFREVRWFGNTIWQATGLPKTWGESWTNDFPSEQEARAGFQAACREAEQLGFRLTDSGCYRRDGIDRTQLVAAIAAGAKRAFEAMRAAHPDQLLTCFGLCSDDSAMTIVPAANSKEALSGKKRDDERRWIVTCWEFDEGDEYLDPAYRMILPPSRDIPCDRDYDHGPVVFESCVDALARLREEGFFGPISDDLVVLFQVGDSDEGVELNQRLNTNRTYQQYKAWIGG